MDDKYSNLSFWMEERVMIWPTPVRRVLSISAELTPASVIRIGHLRKSPSRNQSKLRSEVVFVAVIAKPDVSLSYQAPFCWTR